MLANTFYDLTKIHKKPGSQGLLNSNPISNMDFLFKPWT